MYYNQSPMGNISISVPNITPEVQGYVPYIVQESQTEFSRNVGNNPLRNFSLEVFAENNWNNEIFFNHVKLIAWSLNDYFINQCQRNPNYLQGTLPQFVADINSKGIGVVWNVLYHSGRLQGLPHDLFEAGRLNAMEYQRLYEMMRSRYEINNFSTGYYGNSPYGGGGYAAKMANEPSWMSSANSGYQGSQFTPYQDKPQRSIYSDPDPVMASQTNSGGAAAWKSHVHQPEQETSKVFTPVTENPNHTEERRSTPKPRVTSEIEVPWDCRKAVHLVRAVYDKNRYTVKLKYNDEGKIVEEFTEMNYVDHICASPYTVREFERYKETLAAEGRQPTVEEVQEKFLDVPSDLDLERDGSMFEFITLNAPDCEFLGLDDLRNYSEYLRHVAAQAIGKRELENRIIPYECQTMTPYIGLTKEEVIWIRGIYDSDNLTQFRERFNQEYIGLNEEGEPVKSRKRLWNKFDREMTDGINRYLKCELALDCIRIDSFSEDWLDLLKVIEDDYGQIYLNKLKTLKPKDIMYVLSTDKEKIKQFFDEVYPFNIKDRDDDELLVFSKRYQIYLNDYDSRDLGLGLNIGDTGRICKETHPVLKEMVFAALDDDRIAGVEPHIQFGDDIMLRIVTNAIDPNCIMIERIR